MNNELIQYFNFIQNEKKTYKLGVFRHLELIFFYISLLNLKVKSSQRLQLGFLHSIGSMDIINYLNSKEVESQKNNYQKGCNLLISNLVNEVLLYVCTKHYSVCSYD